MFHLFVNLIAMKWSINNTFIDFHFVFLLFRISFSTLNNIAFPPITGKPFLIYLASLSLFSVFCFLFRKEKPLKNMQVSVIRKTNCSHLIEFLPVQGKTTFLMCRPPPLMLDLYNSALYKCTYCECIFTHDLCLEFLFSADEAKRNFVLSYQGTR